MTNTNLYPLIRKYDRPVPRYTSFPTAAQFHTDMPSVKLDHCINALADDQTVSIYVHIPFCHSLCHYCGCNTKIVNAYNPIDRYITELVHEIEIFGQKMRGKIPVSHIHFGGGSPNSARTEDLNRILNALKHDFHISSTSQIAMECDPRLLSTEKISVYAALGIKRVSLGIQDFNRSVQEAINRIQPFELIKQHVSDLRNAGIDDINFDLIVGLPKQTQHTIHETVNGVAELRPSRVAVFPYAHVPWMKKHQKLLEKYEMPDGFTRLNMILAVKKRLQAEGYHAIGIDHFALEEDGLTRAYRSCAMRRNFQGYTDDPTSTIIGFGLSAISQYDDAYFQNTTDTPQYRKAIANHQLPMVKGVALSTNDQAHRSLIEELMCYFSVDLADYPEVTMPHDALSVLAADDLISLNGTTLSISETGQHFVRIVASCFDPYFDQQSAQHAKAV